MIETDRLILRKFEPNDAEEVFKFASNSLVNRYLDDPIKVKTIEQAKKIITDVWLTDYNKYGYGRLAIIEKSSNKLIGFCGLKFLEQYHLPDLGYRMLPDYWGRGYATEAATAVLTYGNAILDLNKFMGMAHVENLASEKVLLNLGFSENHEIQNNDDSTRFYSLEIDSLTEWMEARK